MRHGRSFSVFVLTPQEDFHLFEERLKCMVCRAKDGAARPRGGATPLALAYARQISVSIAAAVRRVLRRPQLHVFH